MVRLFGTFTSVHDHPVQAWKKLHNNANALSRIDIIPCPCEDYPDHGHLIKKVKLPSEKKPRLLHVIQTRGQDGDHDLDTVKPNSQSFREEPPDVKILCSLLYEFRV